MARADRVTRPGAVLAIGGWTLAVAGVVTALALLPTSRESARVNLPEATVVDLTTLLVALLLASLGAVVVMRGRETRYGWVLLGSGVALAVQQGAGEVALSGWYGPAGPTRLTTAAIWLQGHWAVSFAAMSLLLPALFPDGHTVGRWRRPVHVLAGGWTVLALLAAVADVRAENAFLGLADPPENPLGVLPVPLDLMNTAWLVLVLASVAVSGASLRARWRAAHGEQRQQIAWVLLALGLAAWVIFLAVLNVLAEEVLGIDVGLGWLEAAIPLTGGLVALALGLGVLRFRLYAVDLVINRTVVYALMTVLVVVAYAATVTAVSAGTGVDETGASLVGAGLVAAAFAPVRSWVQGRVNRLLFGRRDDPVGVLTELGRRLEHAGAPEETLHTLAETVITALKVPGASVELRLHGGGTLVAVAGRVGAVGELAEDRPLRHQGVELGRLVVARRRRGVPLQAEDHRLLDSLAHHAAALATAVQLQVALQRSRGRLVAAREEERRRLRRDLHDGLGPSLASQMFRLDAVRRLLTTDPAAAAAALTELEEQTRELVADIRRLVDDLRPPALDELGLLGALTAHAAQLDHAAGVRVDVGAGSLGELPAAVEVAAYRIATEALTNTLRHAGAARCRIRLDRDADTLRVRVADDGAGLGAHHPPGVGLTSMRERAEELGGRVTVTSVPGEGTAIEATLPCGPVPQHGDPEPIGSTRHREGVGAGG